MTQYFYQDAMGTVQGPYSGEELTDLARSQIVKHDSPIKVGNAEWRTALEVFGQSQWATIAEQAKKAPPPTKSKPPKSTEPESPDSFSNELSTWIKAIDRAFFILVSILGVVFAGGVAIAFTNDPFAGIISALIGTLALVVLIGIHRFQMIFLRFMRASVDVMIQIRDRHS